VNDNLKAHVVLEFPIVHVVTRDELFDYKIEGEENSGRPQEESNSSESEGGFLGLSLVKATLYSMQPFQG
jgi:hypothetical protein